MSGSLGWMKVFRQVNDPFTTWWSTYQISLLLLILMNQLLKPLLGRTQSRGRFWAAFRLSHRPEPLSHAVHGEVEGLDIRGQHGRLFVSSALTGRKRPTPVRRRLSRPDPGSSWEGHSGRVGSCVGDAKEQIKQIKIVSKVCAQQYTTKNKVPRLRQLQEVLRGIRPLH